MRVQAAEGADQLRVQHHVNWLLRIGDGIVPTQEGKIKLPDEIVTNSDTVHGNLQQVIDHVYGLIQHSYKEPEYFTKRSILSPLNVTVDELNRNILELIPVEHANDEKTYLSIDVNNSDDNNYPIEYLNTIDISGMPPHVLRLKKHAPVILLRNLNPSEGLCNG
jgi:ATP-dependent DNA helicase PIF1